MPTERNYTMPDAPVLFEGDYPPATPPGQVKKQLESEWEEEMAEHYRSVEFQAARGERERLLRDDMSGYLAKPYESLGPKSPAEQEQCMSDAELVRGFHGGLPDSSEEMPAEAVEHTPMRFG